MYTGAAVMYRERTRQGSYGARGSAATAASPPTMRALLPPKKPRRPRSMVKPSGTAGSLEEAPPALPLLLWGSSAPPAGRVGAAGWLWLCGSVVSVGECASARLSGLRPAAGGGDEAG